MPDYAAVEPVQASHDHTGKPEVSNPTPLHLGEVSSSDPTSGNYVHKVQSPMGSTHQSPLHVGTIPLATNVPSIQQPPIETPLRQNPTQPATGHIPTQGYQPMGQPNYNPQFIPQQSGGTQHPTGPTYQNFPPPQGYN